MKDFNWKDFKNHKCGVHCNTSEEARKFIELASKQGMKWADSEMYEINWNYNKANTYYTHKDNLKYGNINANFYNLPIFDFSDIYNKLRYTLGEPKSCYPIDLIEDGMVVETANLQRYLVLTKDGRRILANYYTWLSLDNYDKDLKYYNSMNNLPIPRNNINIIYKVNRNVLNYLFDDDEDDFKKLTKVVWEREDIEFMTLEQVCKELGKKIKIKEN